LRSRLCRKSAGANRCRQNRKQNFGVIFHQTISRTARNDASAKIIIAP
jgi:hypothetical protein